MMNCMKPPFGYCTIYFYGGVLSRDRERGRDHIFFWKKQNKIIIIIIIIIIIKIKVNGKNGNCNYERGQ